MYYMATYIYTVSCLLVLVYFHAFFIMQWLPLIARCCPSGRDDGDDGAVTTAVFRIHAARFARLF